MILYCKIYQRLNSNFIAQVSLVSLSEVNTVVFYWSAIINFFLINIVLAFTMPACWPIHLNNECALKISKLFHYCGVYSKVKCLSKQKINQSVHLYIVYSWMWYVCKIHWTVWVFFVYFNAGGKFPWFPMKRNLYKMSFLPKSHLLSIQVHFTYSTCILLGQHIL